VLIIDDLGLRKFSTSEANDFCDLLKSRIEKSTIITTQLPIDHWSEIIEDPVIADTIIDRMIHTSIKIEVKGGSYRKVQGEILDQKKVKK
jgi:DNA replication protein DnaC